MVSDRQSAPNSPLGIHSDARRRSPRESSRGDHKARQHVLAWLANHWFARVESLRGHARRPQDVATVNHNGGSIPRGSRASATQLRQPDAKGKIQFMLMEQMVVQLDRCPGHTGCSSFQT